MPSVTYLEVTNFTLTTACDPEAEDAEVQVVQAFITAYNQRDAVRIEELVDGDEIWDIGGLPHLGMVLWDDVLAWAEKGWAVNDRLELISVIRYGPKSGSDITVRRTNDVLLANGIDQLVLLIKTSSSGCTIERLIAAVDSHAADGCVFFQTYIERLLVTDAVSDIQVPDHCTT